MGRYTQRFSNVLVALLSAFCLALALSALPSPVHADESSPEDKVVMPADDALYSTGEMLVVFQEGTSEETIAEVIQESETADPEGTMVDGDSGELDSSYVLDAPMDEVMVNVVIDEDTSFEEAAIEIAASEDVVYVQPNFLYVLMDEEESEDYEGLDESVECSEPSGDVTERGDSSSSDGLETGQNELDESADDAVDAQTDSAPESSEEPLEAESSPDSDDAPLSEMGSLAVESLETESLETEAYSTYVDVGTDDSFTSTGTGSRNNWHLGAINARGAWDVAPVDGSVTVAVIDTGCDLVHADLEGVLDTEHAYQMVSSSGTTIRISGVDYTFEQQTPGVLTTSFGTNGDINGHGTHVCGIIGAEADNGVGVAGIACNRAIILPINIFNAYTPSVGEPGVSADTKTVVSAYGYLFSLVENDEVPNLCVINMSLGGYRPADNDQAMHDAITKALNEYGILTVVSAGNNNTTANSWPSDYEECISVTAINQSGARWTSGSSYGSDHNDCKDITAPGANILSSVPSGRYGTKQGTSMAAPMVTGTIALMYATNPRIDAETMRSTLYSSSLDLFDAGVDPYSGHGLVQAGASVNAASTLSPSYDIEDCAITSVPTQAYTGTAITPFLMVRQGIVRLVEGVDYTISYSNNINPGEATITISGKGSFTGSRTISFKISADVSEATVSGLSNQTYTGSAIKPPVTVKIGDVTLVEGTDYSISYSNNVDLGTATVTITGKGHYTGTKKAKFRIVGDISKATVSRIANQAYNGTAIEPPVTVTVSGTTLIQDTDFSVSYSSNINVGTANVTITGKGDYSGSSTTTSFRIVPAKIPIPSGVTGLTYTSLYQTGVETGDGYRLSGTYRSYAAGKHEAIAILTDPSNTTWSDGTTTRKVIPWKISAAPLSEATVTVATTRAYTGSALKPVPTVTLGGRKLVAGTDYTVSYKSNVNPGTATVTITGKGNYTGTKTATFKVTQPFADVNSKTPHYADILWLYANGISTGWKEADGTRTFMPYSDVARCDMAAFLYRLAGSPTYTPTAQDKAYFSDVDSSTPHAKEVWWLAHEGISTGWVEEDGTRTFRPYDSIARCDMAAFLYRLAGSPSYKPTAAQKRSFSDVDSSTPHAKEVWWLASTGVSEGWKEDDGTCTFRPYDEIARCDMAAFLHRMDDKGLVPQTK